MLSDAFTLQRYGRPTVFVEGMPRPDVKLIGSADDVRAAGSARVLVVLLCVSQSVLALVMMRVLLLLTLASRRDCRRARRARL